MNGMCDREPVSMQIWWDQKSWSKLWDQESWSTRWDPIHSGLWNNVVQGSVQGSVEYSLERHRCSLQES